MGADKLIVRLNLQMDKSKGNKNWRQKVAMGNLGMVKYWHEKIEL